MSAHKNLGKVIDVTDTYDENTGITAKFCTEYGEVAKEAEEVIIESKGDPVAEHNKDANRRPKLPTVVECVKIPEPIEPSVSVRLHLGPAPPYTGYAGAKFTPPLPKKMLKKREEERRKAKEAREMCKTEVVRMPSPVICDNIVEKIQMESVHSTVAKVRPMYPSYISPSTLIVPKLNSCLLESHRPKSGIIINIKKEKQESTEFDHLVPPRGRKKKLRQKSKPVVTYQQEDIITAMQSFMYDGEEGEGEYKIPKVLYEDRSTHVSDNVILGKIGELMSVTSLATSMPDKDKAMYDDMSWCDIPAVSKLVQTFRDAQTIKLKKKYKKGALENHSFTRIRQKTLENFCYRAVSGSMHQGDLSFSKVSRNNQGICMPVAAYCMGMLHNPENWNSRTVDEVVEIGNQLFLDSIAELHLDYDRKEITLDELQKHVIIKNKNVMFEVLQPEVKGLIRSTNKDIYNLSGALRIFFLKYNSCLLHTDSQNVMIWKLGKKRYYFFDAKPRKNNLYQDLNGTAVVAVVQTLKAVISILLERSDMGNSPFYISELKVIKILGKDEEEVPPYVSAEHTYRILDERQAVVQGTFDLGDMCFTFTRNKQALSIALVALAYSKISPPNSWHKKTVDKIMVVGNQLYTLCVEAEKCQEIRLQHLPAVFTVGPYIIGVNLYPNLFANCMFKKDSCTFLDSLTKFFEKNSSAIAQIGKYYLAIWQQRGLYFCFDPYTRNKEGLKCRSGGACVTMNKDVETLVDTVVKNFTDKEAIFYLHALKLLKIQRDPQLTKIYPKHMTMHQIPLDTFRKNRMLKSKKKAVEKPVSADFKEKALRKLLICDDTPEDIYDITSNVLSVGSYAAPDIVQQMKFARIPQPKQRGPDSEIVADLDSPSLSDTQIAPTKPACGEGEEIPTDDLNSYELTQEEKELEEEPEGEGQVIMPMMEGAMEGEGSEVTESKFGVAVSQVYSSELDPCYKSHFINTDLTFSYKLLPAKELPIKEPDEALVEIDEEEQRKVFKDRRNFVDVVDGMQILRSRTNAITVCDCEDSNFVAPYMSIMACAFSYEVPLHKWERRTLDFILKAGLHLYKQHRECFTHIDTFKFELDRVKVNATVDLIFNTYIGSGLFETFSGRKVLQQFLEVHVFSKQDCGLVIIPHYACAVFFRNNLFYHFEPFNCDKEGLVLESKAEGRACLMRFKTLEALTERVIQNLSQRTSENDTTTLDFRLLTLAKPVFVFLDENDNEIELKYDDFKDPLHRTQSEELKRPHNFVDLPDGSQLIRGSTKIDDFGPDIETLAPYICVMAPAVGQKYSVRTWSGDIVDFIMDAGNELFLRTKFPFEQLAHLEIPRVSLGTTDFKIEVRYLFDAPMKIGVLKAALTKLLAIEREWPLITTEIYACVTFQHNDLYYLFEPYSVNEVGLNDEVAGTACMSRFKTIHELCTRIMFNKNRREVPQDIEHVRFILSACKATIIPPEQSGKRLRPTIKKRKTPEECEGEGEDQAIEAMEQALHEEEEMMDEEDEANEDSNKIGYQDKGKYQVLEGSKTVKRGSGDTYVGEDHFVNLIASLMLITKPLAEWDTKTVDRVLALGRNVFNHADDLCVAKKRTIKNILITKHLFDIIVRQLPIEDWRKRSHLIRGLKYILRKRKFCVIQFIGSGSYVIYNDLDAGLIHLFHPYQMKFKNKDGEKVENNACWIQFASLKALRRFLKPRNNISRFTLYSFDVTNVTKAPRNVVVAALIREYIRLKSMKQEAYGKPFHECESWLDIHQNPWSRLVDDPKCSKGEKWFNWDIEYNKDLYSLMGTIHQNSRDFKSKVRGKQTLAIAVVAIGMTGIYDLKEWNSHVIDSIVKSGSEYCTECFQGINKQNYELVMDDLLEDCTVFPYKFKIHYQPIVEGTMFLKHPKKYNLYKALRLFFDQYYFRAGVIWSLRGTVKRIVSFAKRQDNEYFMFDSQAWGPPMFPERRGNAYALRCTTLARLVHILVLTLRGGDFYIYEVIADSFAPIMTDEEKERSKKKGDKEEKRKGKDKKGSKPKSEKAKQQDEKKKDSRRKEEKKDSMGKEEKTSPETIPESEEEEA